MAGGCHRPVRSLYQAGEEAEGSDARRRRNPRSRRPPARLQVLEEAEPVTPVERAHEEEEAEPVTLVERAHEEEEEQEEEEVSQTPQEGDEEEASFDEQEALAGGTGSSSSAPRVYLRGPASLPAFPLPHRRPVIRPEGQK